MQELWDEEYTDLCRENFINAMYKFPDTPVNELENGREMPILGVGTWLKQNVQDTIEQALRAGFRSVYAFEAGAKVHHGVGVFGTLWSTSCTADCFEVLVRLRICCTRLATGCTFWTSSSKVSSCH